VPVAERVFPQFERKILSEGDGKRIVRTGEGVIQEEATDHTAFPRYIKHPVENLHDFEVLKERLDPNTPGRFPADWGRITENLKKRDFILVGGLDKRELAKGKAAIDAELEAKLPVVFKRGGYIPTMDHRVPPEVSWPDFLYYLRRTQEIYKRCGR